MYIAMCVDLHISVYILTFEHGVYEAFSLNVSPYTYAVMLVVCACVCVCVCVCS